MGRYWLSELPRWGEHYYRYVAVNYAQARPNSCLSEKCMLPTQGAKYLVPPHYDSKSRTRHDYQQRHTRSPTPWMSQRNFSSVEGDLPFCEGFQIIFQGFIAASESALTVKGK